MLQMLSGLLDYGEVQDGRFRLKSEPFGLAALAEAVRDALRAEGAGAAAVAVLPGAPERVARRPRPAAADLRAPRALHARGPRSRRRPSSASATTARNLIGEIAVAARRRIDRLEARPAHGPERDRARPGDGRGAAPADRPRPDLGLRRRADPGRGRPDGRRDDPRRGARRAGALRADPRASRDPLGRARRHLPGGAALGPGGLRRRRRAPARWTSCWWTAPASARFR